MNEKQLIQLTKDGETDAYRRLVERYQTGLILHCENIVRDRAHGEDIAQDAFVKAFYALHTYRSDKGAFSTWLYRIATNLAKDYLRKTKQKFDLSDVESFAAEAPELSHAEIREIQAAVKGLEPPEYSRVVQAYYWEGKKYDEIALELNVPTSTVGTWLKRAKVQLRKELS